MQKNFSFFGHGMRVVMFSLRNYEKNKIGWYFDGSNFTYQRNELLKVNNFRFLGINQQNEVQYFIFQFLKYP